MAESEEGEVFNSENYRSGGKINLTFKQIVLEHVKKCVSYLSVEWTDGYWNVSGAPGFTKTYFPSTRKKFINSVIALKCIKLNEYADYTKTKNMNSRKVSTIKAKEQYDALTQTYNKMKLKYESIKKITENNQERKIRIEDKWKAYEIDYYIKVFQIVTQLCGLEETHSNEQVVEIIGKGKSYIEVIEGDDTNGNSFD